MRPLPGALRLLRHLKASGCRVGLATSTPRATLALKTANKPELAAAAFDAAVCGDDVANGKPAPDVFLECCARLGVAPAAALVFEDAPSGAAAAAAAGCRVVVVPSTGADDFDAPDAAAASGACLFCVWIGGWICLSFSPHTLATGHSRTRPLHSPPKKPTHHHPP